MEPGYFTPGDIMVSIRNINAVVVFENESMAVKFISIGQVIRHHDPDFVDGDTISIFDNNNLQPLVEDGQSRIVRVDAPSGELVVTFTGTAARPFFTDIMGKHQLLDNGNLLITESRAGRALEISAQGKLVWEYNNVVRQDVVGLLSEAQRLDQRFDRSFFEQLAAACPAP